MFFPLWVRYVPKTGASERSTFQQASAPPPPSLSCADTPGLHHFLRAGAVPGRASLFYHSDNHRLSRFIPLIIERSCPRLRHRITRAVRAPARPPSGPRGVSGRKEATGGAGPRARPSRRAPRAEGTLNVKRRVIQPRGRAGQGGGRGAAAPVPRRLLAARSAPPGRIRAPAPERGR